jgi:hypothetical protein
MRKLSFALILIAILIAACKKKKEDFIPLNKPVTTSIYPPASDFMPFKAGNYWIMQEYYIDTSGTETKTGITDSMYISDVKVQNGNTFYGLQSRRGTLYIRTSGTHAYLINDSLYFSTEKLGDTLRRNSDSIGRAAYYMVNENLVTTVPAGTFITYTVEGRVQVTANTSIGMSPRYTWDVYGQKTGPVLKRYFVTNRPGYYEMRLVRYKLN